MKKFMFTAAFCATSAFTFGQSVKPAPGAELGRTIPLPDRFGLQSQSTMGLSTAAPDALGAVPRREKGAGKGTFMAKHNAHLQRAKEGPVGLLFLGDSITEGWTKAPEIWQAHFGRYQPANFGLGADETQHLLWRIDDGELDGIRPKVVVLLIGTHNTGLNTAPQIAAANEKIIQAIHAKLPETKVLLLGLFPRGPHEYDLRKPMKRMAVVEQVNALLATLDNGKNIRFLDLGPRLRGADGVIPTELLADLLHPTAAGYKVWAEAMQPLLEEMMRE